MEFYLIILIAFALAIDAFAVSFAAGSFYGKATKRQKFRLSFHFGLFQFFMPILGWLAGSEIVKIVENYDHWIALLILIVIGGKMIIDSLSQNDNKVQNDITKGFSLVNLSIATSIDALAVGFSLGIVNSDIIIPSIIIGIVASTMSLLGIKAGESLSHIFGRKISIFGGIVLILIGFHILFKHLQWI
ncbi:manganese efflux pump [Bacteroidetes/Chlorobi group bacterium ChocPot_Mid]|jgi:putative Mn2+ efflux pump MntP|nr:MAG: manganese efflux pump [Bacteroidetes/Chlorobi group bacterium ChocPot_Mid]